MVVGILSERDTWCLFLRYYSIVLELASHIFLQVSLVRLSVQWFYFSSSFSRRCVSRSDRIKFVLAPAGVGAAVRAGDPAMKQR